MCRPHLLAQGHAAPALGSLAPGGGAPHGRRRVARGAPREGAPGCQELRHYRPEVPRVSEESPAEAPAAPPAPKFSIADFRALQLASQAKQKERELKKKEKEQAEKRARAEAQRLERQRANEERQAKAEEKWAEQERARQERAEREAAEMEEMACLCVGSFCFVLVACVAKCVLLAPLGRRGSTSRTSLASCARSRARATFCSASR